MRSIHSGVSQSVVSFASKLKLLGVELHKQQVGSAATDFPLKSQESAAGFRGLFFFSPLMSNNKLWGSFFDDMDDPATDHQGAARCGSPLKTGPWLLLHHVCLLWSFSHCNAARHEGAEWMSSISLTQRG